MPATCLVAGSSTRHLTSRTSMLRSRSSGRAAVWHQARIFHLLRRPLSGLLLWGGSAQMGVLAPLPLLRGHSSLVFLGPPPPSSWAYTTEHLPGRCMGDGKSIQRAPGIQRTRPGMGCKRSLTAAVPLAAGISMGKVQLWASECFGSMVDLLRVFSLQ